MASPAKKTAQEREDTDYDPGTSGSEAGTPKKGRKKKETPDPGLTLGTDIEDHLKPDGRQVEVELDNVRIDQEKTKEQIRRKDTKLLQKRIESLVEFGMRKNILEKSETRQNNRSFHMKRGQKIAHFMKNTLFFEKMRNWHPKQ
uniref:Uncharacterized protein n=1 Tax=Eutreptiella gymnastica TaxID=73025 RepID=A0A7S4CS28_9EUGL